MPAGGVGVSGSDGEEGGPSRCGMYALLCTDSRLSAPEVVEQYLGKDFVEKAFRTWKSGIEVEPVRHRRERRVRAYLFVCSLAYRLEMALRWKLLEDRSRVDRKITKAAKFAGRGFFVSLASVVQTSR